MKKKLAFFLIALTLIFSLTISMFSTTYALENEEVYYYEDESAKSSFTLIDETNYKCEATNLESGDIVNITGTYTKQENRIIFYLAGEVLIEGEIGENNVLVVSEFKGNENLQEETGLEDVESVEEYTAKITNWIISGLLGLLGTSAVMFAFRKQIKELVVKILEGLNLLKVNKDDAEEKIKKVVETANDTLKDLSNIKEELLETNKDEFKQIQDVVFLLVKAFVCFANSSKEHIANGSAECIGNLLKDLNVGVSENANKKVQ